MKKGEGNVFEEMIRNQVKEEARTVYDNLENLEEYPIKISREILKVLIENACLGQNHAPIEIARNKICEINSKWLENNFFEVSNECINYSDAWEYRRLVELVSICIPKLKQRVLEIGLNSLDEEVREVVEDYL